LARRIAAVSPGRDRAAESALYGSLAPRVRLYGLRHLRDPAAADELAQDVLLMTIHFQLRSLHQLALGEPGRSVALRKWSDPASTRPSGAPFLARTRHTRAKCRRRAHAPICSREKP